MEKFKNILSGLAILFVITLSVFLIGACTPGASPEPPPPPPGTDGITVGSTNLANGTQTTSVLKENSLGTGTIPYGQDFSLQIFQTPGYNPTFLELYYGSIAEATATILYQGYFNGAGMYAANTPSSGIGWVPGVTGTATNAIWEEVPE